MSKALIALLLVILALVLGVAYSFWQSRQVVVYELEVINRSAATVDAVRLFGTGTQAEATLKQLKPGRSALISVLLKKQGGLRFEVSQGGNRIDSFINPSVKAIASFNQQLLINPGHRYLISDYEELLLAD